MSRRKDIERAKGGVLHRNVNALEGLTTFICAHCHEVIINGAGKTERAVKVGRFVYHEKCPKVLILQKREEVV